MTCYVSSGMSLNHTHSLTRSHPVNHRHCYEKNLTERQSINRTTNLTAANTQQNHRHNKDNTDRIDRLV